MLKDLTAEDLDVLNNNFMDLYNAKDVDGFYPRAIKKGTRHSDDTINEYLEKYVVNDFNLTKRYVIYDDMGNFIGNYGSIEEVPEDTTIENDFGEEVYISGDEYSILYGFNR